MSVWLGLQSVGEAQIFRGYLQGGATLSQIDGDNLAGYNRFGGAIGAGVWYDLSDKWRSSLTLSYAQNGSKASGREAQRATNAPTKIYLDYITIPVSLHYMDWLSSDQVFYRVEFIAGLEFRRLISSKTLNALGVDIDPFQNYRQSGLGLILGGWYSINEKTAIGFQHHWGLLSANARNQQTYFTKQVYIQLRRAF